MASAVAKYAAKKMLGSEMDKYKSKTQSGRYDPYYEEIPHPRKPNKTKKVKKQIPAYIPEKDANVLARARKSAYRLDFALFNFAGLRFGWSSVIGIIPLLGDFADTFLALFLIRRMQKVSGGLPSSVLGQMYMNLALDTLVGLVPFLGDLADAYFKCNGKNVRLLEEYLDKKYKPQDLVEAHHKLPEERRPRPATVYEDFSDEEDARHGSFDDRHGDVGPPPRAHAGRRAPDEEMGLPRDDTRRAHKEKSGRSGTKSSRRH